MGWNKMTARHSPMDQGNASSGQEDTYATCPECLRRVKVGRGNKLASHTIPNTAFLCEGTNHPIKDITTNG